MGFRTAFSQILVTGLGFIVVIDQIVAQSALLAIANHFLETSAVMDGIMASSILPVLIVFTSHRLNTNSHLVNYERWSK